MIIYKNRLIFGIISKIISLCLKLVFKLISLFQLQLALVVSIVGIIVYATGGFEDNTVGVTIYLVVLFITVLYAILGTIRKFLGLDDKKKKSKEKDKKDKGKNKDKDKKKKPLFKNKDVAQNEISATESGSATEVRHSESVANPQPEPLRNTEGVQTKTAGEEPKYFRVKNNPNYVMAEYSDRYELYQITNGKLTKVRTDFK